MNRKFLVIMGSLLTAVLVLLILYCKNRSILENWQPLIKDDESLAKALKEIAKNYNQPAIGAALVVGENITAKATVGSSIQGKNFPVNIDSRFHIGSTTKSMTALLIALLVKDKKLRYDMKLEEALPGIPMLKAYRAITMHDLLLNRAGIIAFQNSEYEDAKVVKKIMTDIPKRYNDPTRQRIEMAKVALNLKPINKPGTKVVYSNVGWAIAGLIAELAANQSFESLLKQRIFKPLVMKNAKVGGWPASKKEPNQPRGHYFREKKGGKVILQSLHDSYNLPAWMNPSGGVHCSIFDYALYAKENLLGLQGKGRLLNKNGYQNIHSNHVTAKLSEMYIEQKQKGKITMGYGWAVIAVEENFISAADGSAGTFYARIIIFPKLNVAFAGFTNSGNGSRALDEIIKQMTGFDWQG